MRRLAILVLLVSCGGHIEETTVDASVDATSDARDASVDETAVDSGPSLIYATCPSSIGAPVAPIWAVAHYGAVPHDLAWGASGTRILVSGSMRGGSDLGGGPIGADEMWRPFALLLDTNGKYVASEAWKPFDAPTPVRAFSVAATDLYGGFWLSFPAIGPRTFGPSSFAASPDELGVFLLHLDDTAVVDRAFRFPTSPSESLSLAFGLHSNLDPGVLLTGAGPVNWGVTVAPSYFAGHYGENGTLGTHAAFPGRAGGRGAIPLAYGGFVVATAFEGTALIDGKTITSKGGKDIAVARFDESGKLDWVTTIGGKDDDTPLPAVVLLNDHILVGTSTLSQTVDLGGGNQSVGGAGNEAALIELSQTGTVRAFSRLAPSKEGFRYGSLFAAHPSSKNEAIVSGLFGREVLLGKVDFQDPGSRAFVGRWSPSGDFVWARCFGGEFTTIVQAVLEANDGVVVAITSDKPVDFGSGPILPAEPPPATPTDIMTIAKLPQ